MTIRTTKQLHDFENAIDRCKNTVWLESIRGERYDLKDELDRYRGIGRLLTDPDSDLELFANTREDTAILLKMCRQFTA